ncbi:nucleoside hydrolase [Planctomycetota bacterium]
MNSKIPVILDTDIGTDIDDTWALAFLLRCPELDLKLVTTSRGDTVYRARLAARFLERAGRSNVPVGVGIQGSEEGNHQEAWIKGYELTDYPGTIHEDGVQALIDTVMNSAEPVTVCAIGPLPNIALALEREPRIAENARFVGMHGCFKRSHMGSPDVIAEWNVKADPPACQKVFAAPWDKIITPLDTCGQIRLTGDKYQRVAESSDPLAQDVIDNYRVWKEAGLGKNWTDGSSVLFDTVAVYLCFSKELLEMKKQPVKVTDEGFTLVEEGAPQADCALEWKDMDAFEDFLVTRLISNPDIS